MNNLIIYGSQYVTTKCYAEKLAEKTGIEIINYKDIKNLSDYTTIIYLGGLYAGGVKGLKNTIKLIPSTSNLIIVTVGLADVTDKENTDNIKKALSRQIPPVFHDKAKIFHLRGGIDYKNLNFKHYTMMKLLYTKAKNIPEEKKTPEIKTMIETFNQKVNFIDYNSLDKIIEEINKF